MAEFAYRDGEMFAEDVALTRIAHEVGTPFYCYSSAAVTAAYGRFARAFADLPVTICFAVKANANLSVIRSLAQLGAGADVVSGGEFERALAAGVPAGRIVFSGVGKSREEIRRALDARVMQINVESAAELEAVADMARGLGRKAVVALRVNPDVDAKTHAKITTGRDENKFGIALDRAPELYRRAARDPALDCVGLALHIGSQLLDLAPFRAAFGRLAELAAGLRREGLAVRRLDLGGGLGVAYNGETPPPVAAYAGLVRETIAPLGTEIVIEPGRALVADAGVLVTRVEYVKETDRRRFVIVDAAMNDLLRPALYDAYHVIEPVRRGAEETLAPADVVGPVCETGDAFGTDRMLPELATGDLLVIKSAGAYGAVMASNYNTRPRAAEVLVNGALYAVVRERETIEALLAADRLAPWLAGETARRKSGAA